MSTEQIWKTWKGETYCFWSNAPFDIKPQLGDVNKMPVEGKTLDYQGNHYEVKKVPGKDGKQAWYKVVKTPLTGPQADWEAKQKARDAGFEQRHRDTLERMDRLIASNDNLRESVNMLIEELRKQKA